MLSRWTKWAGIRWRTQAHIREEEEEEEEEKEEEEEEGTSPEAVRCWGDLQLKLL